MRLFVLSTLTTVATAGFAQNPDRSRVIERALEYIHTAASDQATFTDYGGDLLWCFFTIANTAKDPELSRQAARIGRELAVKWRLSHAHVPASADAEDIANLVMGTYTADRLGVKDRKMKVQLREAAARFTAKDYLGFDAPNEPPDLNDSSRYDTWYGALIYTFFGDAYGVTLGAHYRDVIKWLPRLRPYREGDQALVFDEFYAITHLIYTLNAYGEHRVSTSSLGEEIGFIKRRMSEAMTNDDPETVGESMDSMKMLGLENDPLIAQGMQYLLSKQRPDGTWVGDADDVYTMYHSAWTSIDGLRDYRFRGSARKLPMKWMVGK